MWKPGGAHSSRGGSSLPRRPYHDARHLHEAALRRGGFVDFLFIGLVIGCFSANCPGRGGSGGPSGF